MKLISLYLKDFKGISDFHLKLNGRDAVISGDNGTGKTTIADAYHWVLFGKDSKSKGQSEFDIKPLDGNHVVSAGLTPTVELVIEHRDERTLFRKEYTERWTKPRGSIRKILSGHTVKHYINGTPVRKKDYEERVANIIDSDLFQLLSDPYYFNSSLHWKERRGLLVQMCGEQDDDDIINSDDKFAPLSDILDNLSPEDCLKKLKDQRKNSVKELETLPARIEEVLKGLPEIPADFRKESVEKKLTEQRELLQKKGQELALLNSGDNKIRLRELEIELEKFVADHKQKIQQQIYSLTETKNPLNGELLQIKQSVQKNRGELENKESEAKEIELRFKNYQAEWDKINVPPALEEFTTCPTCLQKVPESQLEKVNAEILKKYNLEKAEKLEKLNDQEKQLILDRKRIKTLTMVKNKELQKSNSLLKELEKDLAGIEENIAQLVSKQSAFRKEPGYQAIQKEVDVLKKDSQESPRLKEVAQEIEKIRQEIQKQERVLLELDIFNKGQKRVSELQEKEVQIVKVLERIEFEIALIEGFNRAKIRMLEDKINSSFTMARFKLFEEQLNGTVIETCETLYEGVSYNSTLNDGARVNVGLDIINRFGEYYNFTPPIFFDNAESVTKVIPTNGQLIQLVVAPGELTVNIGADAT